MILGKQSPHTLRKFRSNQRGVGIVENLVAMAVVSIAVVGSSSLFIMCFHSNAATRTFSSVNAEVQAMLDGYRSQNYLTLLSVFGAAGAENIANGAVATAVVNSAAARSTYSVTYTAIKTNPTGIPEAVRVAIQVDHRRGKFDDAQYQFETIIGQSR